MIVYMSFESTLDRGNRPLCRNVENSLHLGRIREGKMCLRTRFQGRGNSVDEDRTKSWVVA